MENNKPDLTLKDYLLISFIALSFTFFTIPIIRNLELEFLKFSFATIVLLGIFLIILANFALWVSLVIARKIPVVLQISKFAAVGGFNTFLNWGIVNLLMLVTQTFEGPLYTAFIIVAFVIANMGSFLWNKYWIFPTDKIKGNDSAKKDFVQFFIVSLIGMGIQAGIATAWVGLIDTSLSAGIWANVGLFIGTVFSMVWNFLGYKFIVFKK
jgi:putative flippase GtrA